MSRKSLKIAGLCVAWAITLGGAYLLGHAGKEGSSAAKEPAAGPVRSSNSAGRNPDQLPSPRELTAAPRGQSTKAQSPPAGLREVLFHARKSASKGGTNPLAMRELFLALDQLSLGEMPGAAQSLMEDLPGQDRAAKRLLLTSLLTRWAELDGQGAAQFVMNEMTRDPAAVTSLSYVLEQWARDDPGAAYSWLQSSGEPGRELVGGVPRDSALFLAGLLTEMASRDPSGALDRLQDVPEPADRQIILSNILLHTEDDTERAAWLRRIDAMPAKTAEVALDHLLNHLISTDPDAAAGWISQMEDPADRERYSRKLGER